MTEEVKKRDYVSAPAIVVETYRKMHLQTYESVVALQQQMKNQKPQSIRFWDLFYDYYCKVIDESDPDLVDHPQWLHCLQSAEAARAAKEPDWMQLLCLIHDVGKYTNHIDMGGLPQY